MLGVDLCGVDDLRGADADVAPVEGFLVFEAGGQGDAEVARGVEDVAVDVAGGARRAGCAGVGEQRGTQIVGRIEEVGFWQQVEVARGAEGLRARRGEFVSVTRCEDEQVAARADTAGAMLRCLVGPGELAALGLPDKGVAPGTEAAAVVFDQVEVEVLACGNGAGVGQPRAGAIAELRVEDFTEVPLLFNSFATQQSVQFCRELRRILDPHAHAQWKVPSIERGERLSEARSQDQQLKLGEFECQ
ncbi:hypothetical protein [Denitromonas sp.]|uniref:hypothetical protein n=1 Tax=Denitromonas sp. TaxID=2734609 RepID=UPI002AFFA61E|nr:hypothetical protein [Denitromonas sp.]